MANDGERLVFMLEARIRDFERNLAKAQGTANNRLKAIEKRADTTAMRMKTAFAQAGSGINAGLGMLGTLGLGGIAGGLSAAGVVNLTKSIAEMSAEAKRAGIAVVPFQEMSYAAQQARVSTDALTDGLKEMQLRADEFILTGAGGGAEAFQRLGYTAEELQEKLKQPDLLFEEIIDKLKRLDTASQIRIADEIFGGTGGEQFVRFLDKGQKSIQDMRSEAHDLGIVMDEGMVDKAEEAAKKFDKLATVIEGRLKGAIVSVVEKFDEWAASVKEFISWLDGTKFGQAQKWLMDNTAIGQGMKAGALLNQAVTGVGPYTMPTPATDTSALKRAFEQGRKSGEVPTSDDWLSRADEAAARKKADTDPGAKPKKESSKTTPGQRFEASIDNLREEIRWLELEQAALGKSTFEAEKLRATQKLLDEARRAGVAISPEIQAQINAEAEAYAQAAVKLDEAHQQMQALDESRDYFNDEMASGISDLITGARSLDDVLQGVTKSLIEAGIQAALLGEGPLASIMGGQGLLGGGGKSGSGGGGLLGQLIGGISGAVSGGGSIGLYDQGGYTGNGGKYDPAGIVHRGEYVFDKAATSRLGAGNLEALRRGKSLPGFASGGAVGIPATLKAPPSMAGAASGGMAQTNNVTVAPVYNITTSGGDKDNAGLKDALAQSNVYLERMVKAVLVEDVRKFGPVSRAYRQRFGLNPMKGVG